MSVRTHWILLLIISFLIASCKKEETNHANNNALPLSTQPQRYMFEIQHVFPHDTSAFTEGLEIYEGIMYESTGLNGKSTLRKVELATGRIKQQIEIDSNIFGEGITIFNNKIYQLTYRSKIGFIYDLKTFKKIGSWTYEGEGWGLTHDSESLIMSNGSNRLYYLNPNTLAIERFIEVTDQGMSVEDLNELELIKGSIYANVWQRNTIAIIDPKSGLIKGWIDLSGLISPEEQKRVDFLNGIAYDSRSDRLLVTGKNWSKMFEIKLVQ